MREKQRPERKKGNPNGLKRWGERTTQSKEDRKQDTGKRQRVGERNG